MMLRITLGGFEDNLSVSINTDGCAGVGELRPATCIDYPLIAQIYRADGQVVSGIGAKGPQWVAFQCQVEVYLPNNKVFSGLKSIHCRLRFLVLYTRTYSVDPKHGSCNIS